MDIKSILKIGFKVLIAGVTGFAMYIGLSGKKLSKNDDNQQSQQADNCINSNYQQSNQLQSITREDNCEFVDKLKGVQEIGGKLLTFIQSLTMTADSFSRIFGESSSNSYMGQSYSNNPWGNHYRNQPMNFGNGVVGNRISPFILEVY